MKKIKNLLALIYEKLFRTNDSAQRIALGAGLGVFCGIIPGIGPVAALFLAMLLHANYSSALIASLMTNTWLSLVTFLLAIKVGSVILKIVGFQRPAALKIILLPILGYLIIALGLGLLAYLASLIAIKTARKGRRDGSQRN